MKPKLILLATLFSIAGFLTSCGTDDPRSIEAKKKARLRIRPTGYENMTEEQVEQEQQALEAQAEPAGDGL